MSACGCKPGDGCLTPVDDRPITDEEFEAAKAHWLERGGIPPSLQRVIDLGGRFRLGARAGESEAREG